MDLEKVAAAAKEYDEQQIANQEAAEREANKTIFDRIGDAVDSVNETVSEVFDFDAARNAFGETYNNGYDMNPTTPRPLGKLENVAGDVVNAIQTANEKRVEFLQQGANMQEAYQQARETGDYSILEKQAETLRQSGRDASVAMTNVAASPFRQAARNFIASNADDNTSPFQGMAQSLQKSDVNLEYFMTSEEKLQKSREIEQELGLPAESTLADNEAYKAALDMYNFKKANDSIENVWEEYPELKEIAGMDKQAAAIALHNIETVRQTHGIIDSFTHFMERGNIKLEYDNLQYKIMRGEADSNDIQRAENLKKMMDDDKKKAPSFLDNPAAAMAAGVAQSLPEMSQGIKEGVKTAAPSIVAATLFTVATGGTGGAALLAGAGAGALRAALVRAVASQGVKSIGTRAFQIGMFKGMAEAETGSRYAELGELKDKDGNPLLSENDRRLWAAAGGAANAGIEMLDFGLITNALKPTPHAARVFEDIIKNQALKKSQAEKTAELVGGRAKDWLKLTAAESGEEALQSAADDVIHNTAVASTGERGSNNKTYSLGEIAGRSAAAFIESIPGSMGFATIGAGGGLVGRAGVMARSAKREAEIARVYGQEAVKTMNGTIMVEQLQQAVNSGKMKDTAPDVQKKVLREQLAGTGYEMAHIDVEMALQKDSGIADLKKIAKAAGMSSEELDSAISEQAYLNIPVEVLAQAENTPDLLDSVTFSEQAESMARMRANQKEITEAYQQALKQTIDNRQQLIDNIINQSMPNATKEQKEMLETAIMMNPDNPAQGYNALRVEVQRELDEVLAPAIKALQDGMGNAGLMEVDDEQGNKKTIRYTENAEWYRNFYKAFKRRPNKQELEDMAIAMLTGDASAPQVQGWTVDSAEMQAALEQNKGNISRLKNRLKTLQEIKSAVEPLTGVEMQLTEGLTPDGFRMYRQIADWLRHVGGATARQARMGAILAARHADIYAAKVTERTGKKYTAADYMRDKLGFSVRRAEAGYSQLAGVNAREINAQQLKIAKEMLSDGDDMDTIFKETGWLQGADGKWRFEIPDNLDKIHWANIKNGSLWQVYDNERLYEAYPWLSSIPVKLNDMAPGHNGRVAGDVYRYIEINSNIPDEEKSKTLIHEIQHLIQEYEGFAVGGNMQQVRQQIQGQIESLRRKLAGIPQAEEYIRVNNEFFTAIESGSQESLDKAWEAQARMEEEIPESTRTEIDSISLHLNNLEKALQEETDDYRLYLNLAGEQEARETAFRAKYMTEYKRAFQDQVKAQLAYEKEVKKQPLEMLEKLRELQHLESKIGNGVTDEENARAEQLRTEIEPKLLEAFDDRDYAIWVTEDKADSLKTPVPHNDNAVVVFGGQEMAMSQELNNVLYQRAWHGSPYDFETFDLGATGSGQGGAVHGWGLYFAKNKQVSEKYRNSVAAYRNKETGEIVPSFITNAAMDMEERYGRDKAIKSIKDSIAENPEIGNVETKKQMLEFLTNKERYERTKGKLYQVDIPGEKDLIQEEDNYQNQSKTIQKKLKKTVDTLSDTQKEEFVERLKQYFIKEPAKDANVEELNNQAKAIEKAINAARRYHTGKMQKAKEKAMERGYINTKNIERVKSSPEEAEQVAAMYEEILRETQKMAQEAEKKADPKLIAERKKQEEKIESYKKEPSKMLENEGVLSGKEIYNGLSAALGGQKAASIHLNQQGIKGITWSDEGGQFVIFDDKAIDIIEKYNQEVRNQQIKGQTSLQANGKRIVSILETADESTFMHEMAHVFLYDLQDLAQIDDVSAKELEVVNEWAEWQKGQAAEYKSTPWAKEFAAREQAIIDAEAAGDHDRAEQLKREWRQERFARGFELYLKDGQAPAKGLKAVFRKFKTFLRQIYAAFVSDGGKPTLPVKRVMDRMIATEQEIEAMELDDRYADVQKAGGAKLFEESEQDTYNRWYQEATDEAKEKLLKVVMKDLEKEKQAQFDLDMEQEENRKRRELQQEPVYLAEQAVMASGDEKLALNWYPSIEAFQEELVNTQPLEEVLTAHMEQFSKDLDARLIESHLSPEAVEKAMKASKYRVKLESLKGKAMAAKLGLINKINSKAEKAMESIEDKLNAMPEDTDLKMDADSSSVKNVINEINKLRYAAKWSADDLRHIESMIRANTQEEIRTAIKELRESNAKDKIKEEEILKANEGRQAVFRTMAIESMAMKPISDSCNVYYYMQQEKKAARRVRDMIRAKRWDMAIRAQEQQGIFAAMAEIAEDNREKRNKLLAQVNRELTARTVRLPKNERYWHRHLAYILRIAKTDAVPPDTGFVQLNDLLNNMAESLDILEHSLDNVLVMANRGEDFKGYQDLTMDEFKEAVESLHVIYTVGKDKFKMKTIAGKSIIDVVDEITSDDKTIAANVEVDTRKVNADKGGVAYSELIGNTGDIGHLIAKRGQDYIISSLKPENILKMLGSAAHKYIYGTLERAAENEAKMQAENIQALRDIMSAYTHEERQNFDKKIYDLSTEKGEKISKAQIMCMALNWGTMSNRQRLIGGLASDERTPEAVGKMTEEVLQLFRETMTARDWQVIQKLWDHIGTYWEDTVKVEEQLNGVSLEKIPALPFTIISSDGQEMKLQGGYMPVKYAPEKSSRAEENESNELVQSMMAGAMRFGAGRNFTKGRTEFDIFRPLQLDFAVVEEHLQNVIHNATYRLPVRDVYRLITNKDFEDYVTNHIGREYHKVLKDWAVDVWKQVNPDTNTADNVLSRGLGMLRRSATMSIMGYRIWPVIENVSNIAVASGRIGSGEMMAALGDFYSDLRGNFDSVKQKSIFMRNRLENLDRDIRSQVGIFHASNKLLETARDHAYDLMVYSDLMVSAPLWLRSYKNSLQPMIETVKTENEKNIAYLIECQQKVDKIRAEIADLRGEAKAMDEHLKDRRYASPETAEMLRQSPFAMHTDNDLRALSGENMKKAKAMERDLWEAEVAFEEAREIKILSDDEILDEAEQRAIFEADGVVRDTFGSGRTLDLPAVQRSRNEITKLLTTFYGFFNTQFNAVAMAYFNSAHLPASSAIEKWAPFAKQIMFRFVLTALIGSTLQFGLGLAGNDDDDKKRKIKDANGKDVEVDIPSYERFLKVFGKNTISTATGSMYLVRDVVNAVSDFVINGKTYGMNTGSVAGRGASEIGKMFVLLSKKGQKDAEIQAKQEKKEKEHQEKLAKLKGKKRQEYLKKYEENKQYEKPPKRITYTEIAGHGLKGLSSLTAANTGITSTMVNAVTSIVQYMLDTDMRYDPTWKNVIWSALFDKKPVEREIPKKPPTEPKNKKKKKSKQSEL